jgi:O-antigen/teichoic acid export membrane protein
LATLPITIVIVFFGDTILDLWVGSEYTDVDVAVLWFSAFNFFFSTYLWTSLNVLMGSGEIRRIFKISVFEVLLVVVLIVILIPRFGLIGLALGGLIANVVTGIFLFVPAACRKTNLKAWHFVTLSLLTPLLAAGPGYLAGYFLRQSMGSGSWIETLFAAGLTGAISLIALVLFATSRRDRARYYVTLRRLIGVG